VASAFVLLTQCCSSDQIREKGIDGAFSTFEARRGTYRILLGETE